MNELVTIIYANRNRDAARIKASFISLAEQDKKNFKVIFVDYGSREDLVGELQAVATDFDFVHFYHLRVSGLLWNKSKALNFGVSKAATPYIFIADVDLIFHPRATELFERLAHPKEFHLFRLSYLGEKTSRKLQTSYKFEDLEIRAVGDVNGMVLTAKDACLKVNGLDEFFHFYGAEDEDFFSRLELAGYKRTSNKEQYFLHNWHPSFSGTNDKVITKVPRMKSAMRINERHYHRNKEKNIIKPIGQSKLGELKDIDVLKSLDDPTCYFRLPNILAHVKHFLNEELPRIKGEIVRVEFYEDPYFLTMKYRAKKLLGKQSQVYCSMKEVNDLLLEKIIFEFRDFKYSFDIADDLKSIIFYIKL